MLAKTKKSAKTKRTWRRVGWGALIALGVLVTIVAVALWLGPPRDPKCFALDDEDFGLGFRVGDPWDPDAFEAAMNERGLEIRADVYPYPEPREFGSFNESWDAKHGLLHIHVMSDDKSAAAVVRSISVYGCGILEISESDLPKELAARVKAIKDEYSKEAKVSKRAATRACYGRTSVLTGELVPQVRSKQDIGFGTTSEKVVEAYGRPSIRLSVHGELVSLSYVGDEIAATFWFSGDHLDDISLSPGYRHLSFAERLELAQMRLAAPLIGRLLEAKFPIDEEDTASNTELSPEVREE